ncbi:hypothetical protein ACHWQZ_G014978 [Mnemiopsis leidyi]
MWQVFGKEDTITALQSNPCLWWFCAACVYDKVASTPEQSDEISAAVSSDNQVELLNTISQNFAEKFTEKILLLKKELSEEINEAISTKLSVITSKSELDSDVVDITPSYASKLGTNEVSCLPQVALPQQVPRLRQPSEISQISQVTQCSSPEVLVLYPSNGPATNSSTMHKVKKYVENTLKTSQTEFVNCYDDTKKITIGFCNTDLREKASALISSERTLESFGYQSKNSNKLLPKITIEGVSCEVLSDIDYEGAGGDPGRIRDLEKHQIIMKIVEKNPAIKQLCDKGHTFTVVYLKKVKRGKMEREELTIGLKVSPLVHNTIFTHQNSTLYLGNSPRYQVKNRFFIKQCYHCQLIGHTSADCPKVKDNKFPVCLYCAGKHRSSECMNKANKGTHQCARCKESTYRSDAESAKTHNAGSPDCPMMEFDEYLDTLVGKSGSPIICGDFNFHVENNTNSTAQNFISLCESKERSEFWNEKCQSARRERRKAKRQSKKHPNDEELRAIHHEKSVDAAITINMARNSYYERMLSQHKGDARATHKVINKLLDKEFEEKLESIIKALPNKSSLLDPIPMWLFKHCLPELLPVVHYIVNESLRTGKFPSALKEASIRPGLKKPSLDVDELKNYRPISNLTYLSKILEKVVHEQLYTFIDSNNMFSSFQSGYRKNHSCETAVTKIHNDILMMIDKKENVVLLLLDLSAAFDTINHRLLLNKLQRLYGINDVAINWLSSYLSNRSYKVVVNQKSSGECLLKIGVPQGSILGPLLFILYTKDLESIVTKFGFTIHLYADDTQIYFAFDVHSDSPDMQAIDLCCSEVKKWMATNFLKLNEDKTEFIEIGPYVSPITSLRIAGTELKPVDKAKNLGFLFDHQMNLDAQINAVSQVCYMNQRDLTKIGSKLSHDLKVQMVHSNILCFVDYCNSVYGKLSEKNIQKLQKIQNNAVRFIFGLYGKKKNEAVLPYLKKLHFLPIRVLNYFNTTN